MLKRAYTCPWPATWSRMDALDRAFAQMLQARAPSPDPHHATLAALASHAFGAGHACLDLDVLVQSAETALAWADRPADWDASLARALADAADTLPWAARCEATQAQPLVLEGRRLYLARAWHAEQRIAKAIRARLALALPDPEPDQLRDMLDALFGVATSGAPPDWQRVACALALRRPFTVLTGGPGTGKTTTVVRLLALCMHLHLQRTGRPLRVALAAPTGKAAARMAQAVSIGVAQLPGELRFDLGGALGCAATQGAQTLHKLIGTPARPVTAAWEVDLVVVDEASMIDLEMTGHLLATVPAQVPLLLLGDKDQLASVEAGAVLAQICAGATPQGYRADTLAWLARHAGIDLGGAAVAGGDLAQQIITLRDSRRFDPGSAIAHWASLVHAGDGAGLAAAWHGTALATPQTAQVRGGVTRIEQDSEALGRLRTLVLHLWSEFQEALRHDGRGMDDSGAARCLKALARAQVLCAVREGPWGTLALQRHIARWLGGPDLRSPEAAWSHGRALMVTRNDPALGLMNGDIGLCLLRRRPAGQTDIRPELRVAFEREGSIHWVHPGRLEGAESMLAMTVHKAQGSEAEHVVLVMPGAASPLLSRELLYTGITRARHHLTVVAGDAGVLQAAVGRRVTRQGGLTLALAEPGGSG